MNDYSYGIIPFSLLDGEPRYFIGRSSDADGTTGFWKFPKGHKEEGETDLQAARRETKEEIGIDVDEGNVLTGQSFEESYEFTYGAENKRGDGIVQKVNTYWLAEVNEEVEVQLNEEFSEYRWATFADTMELLPDNSRDFLVEANRVLQSII
jgi:8-oxo-dGTP pyrophosphatase MutT (NUDIX family)